VRPLGWKYKRMAECDTGATYQKLGRYLRVVTEADGETVHNAFPDRRFKESS